MATTSIYTTWLPPPVAAAVRAEEPRRFEAAVKALVDAADAAASAAAAGAANAYGLVIAGPLLDDIKTCAAPPRLSPCAIVPARLRKFTRTPLPLHFAASLLQFGVWQGTLPVQHRTGHMQGPGSAGAVL
jgi:hypothetical protein